MGVRYFGHQVQEQLSVCQWVSIHIVHNTANKGASNFALEILEICWEMPTIGLIKAVKEKIL